MPRSTKVLLATTLAAAVWLLGASAATHGTPGAVRGGTYAHDDAPTYTFGINDVFDTKWNAPTQYNGSGNNVVSTTTPLSVNGLNYPYTDIPEGSTTDSGNWNYLDPSELSTGDYYGLVYVGPSGDPSGDWQLILYNPDGSEKQLIDSSGQIYLIGANFIFFVGPFPNGTLLVDSSSLSLTTCGTDESTCSASLPVDVVSPTESQVQQALSTDAETTQSSVAPTIIYAGGGDAQATVSWDPPSGDDSAIIGYDVQATDETSESDSSNVTTQFFSLTSDAGLTTSDDTYTATVEPLTDGDTYEFAVAALYSWGLGSYSDESSSTSVTAPTTTTTMPPPPPPTTTTTLAPIAPSSPTISNIPASPVVGGSFTADVATNSDGTPSVESETSTVCTASELSVQFIASGTCILEAQVASSPTYNAATGTDQSFSVAGKTPSSVTISNFPSSATINQSFNAIVKTDSNGTTSVVSTTPDNCTASGLSVQFVGAGLCTLDAKVDASTTYAAATGSDQSVTVAKMVPSSVTISNFPSSATITKSFTAVVTTDSNGTTSVVSTTPNTCTASGLLVQFVGAGKCTLDAKVDASMTYAAATGSDQSVTVDKLVPSTLTISNLPSSATITKSFNAVVTTDSDGTKSVVSTTPNTCTASGLAVQFVGAGPCTLDAVVAESTKYSTLTSSGQTFNVAKLTPTTLTISNIPAFGLVGKTLIAEVNTDSDGATSVTSLTTNSCVTNGLTVQFVGTGTCTLEAVVAASMTYSAATGDSQDFNISPVKGAETTTTTTIPPTTTTTVPTTTSTASPASVTTTTTQGPTDTTTTTVPTTIPVSGTTTTFSSSDSTTTTTIPPTTTTTLAPSTSATISFCGAPGVSIVNCQVNIAGQGADPGSTVTFEVHSTPTRVGTATVQPDGTYDVKGVLPADLPIGVHHVVVTGTTLSGNTFTQEEVFTVIAGKRIGAIGWVPPAPLAGDVQFVATSHRTNVLAATAGATATAAAVASGLGGGLAFGGGGGATPTGGGSGGSGGSRGGGSLEAVELERFEGETREEGFGDKTAWWRRRGMRFIDRWSKMLPRRVSAVSPVLGRILVDGDYLRAVLGSLWIGLCLASIGLGAYASASSGWYAVPPSLGLFLVILALGVFDSTLGFLAGATFLACSLFAGHISSAPELRLSMGLTLIWFAVPLAAAALRPLRRTISRNIDAIWERIADLVVCGLFAAWVAEKMTSALSGLSGVELPLNRDVRTIVLAVLGFVAVRIVFETIVAHHFPGRLAAVRHEGRLESGRLQKLVSLLAQIAVFVFVSSAILGASWALYVGTAVFFTPVVLGFFEERFPKSEIVAKWKPNGILTWTLIICIGVLLGELIKHTIHNDHLVEQVGFIVLPIPVLIFWTIELFEEKEKDEEESEPEELDEAPPVETARSRVAKAQATQANVEMADASATSQTDTLGNGKAPVAVLEETVAMSQRRRAASVTVASSQTDLDDSSDSRRSQKRTQTLTDEPPATNETTTSSDHHRLSQFRKWAMRLTGVGLIAISVLLVHFQGGG